jgi:hypothetical protein
MKIDYDCVANILLTTYENVCDLQRSNPLCLEDENEIASVNETWGHPTEVVIHVAKLLLDYFRRLLARKDNS